MNRTLSTLFALDRRKVLLAGNASLNGTSAPTANYTKGVTLTRTGVGAYLITLTEPVRAIVMADANLGMGAPSGGLGAYVGAISKNAAGKWQVVVTIANSSGTATDIATASGNALHWTIIADDTSTN